MNTAIAVRAPRASTSSQEPAQTANASAGYSTEVDVQVAADEYQAIAAAPATAAKGLIDAHRSTFIPGTATVQRPSVRVAEWDGYVTEVSGGTFTAALTGIWGEGVAGEQHDAEIARDDVGKSDLALLRLGAFFRLCIYSQMDDDDRPKRYAKVVFRRLPAYRQADLDAADRRSEARHRRLRVE